MKKLKTAIIGCGNISGVHVNAINKSNKAELVAVVDIIEERAKKAAKLHDCKYFTDYRDLSKMDLDVVHICTPHFLHYPMAVDMLESGFNVLVEKPLAITVKQAAEMIETAAINGQRLGVVYQNRFNENALLVKKIIAEKIYGNILGIRGFLTWCRDKKYYQQDKWRGYYKTEGGGVLINQAIHTLDLLSWFVGDVRAIKGHVDTRVLNDIIEVEDTAEATIYYENGVVGLFYASNCFATNSPVEIEISFEKGSLKLIGDNLLITGDGKEYYNMKKKSSKYKSYWGNGHLKLIEGFYSDIIEDKEENIIKGEEGLKTLQLIEGIYTSSRTGNKYILNK